MEIDATATKMYVQGAIYYERHSMKYILCLYTIYEHSGMATLVKFWTQNQSDQNSKPMQLLEVLW